jgi:hypothetical protein
MVPPMGAHKKHGHTKKLDVRTRYPPCERTKSCADPIIVCANENRVRERDSCARCPSVCGSGERVYDFSGVCVVPNPLQKTRAHSTCTCPPDPHTERHRAHRRTSRTRFSFAHTIFVRAHGGPLCAHLTFLRAHVGYHVQPGRTKKSCEHEESQMGAHDVHTHPTCAQKLHVRNGPLGRCKAGIGSDHTASNAAPHQFHPADSLYRLPS